MDTEQQATELVPLKRPMDLTIGGTQEFRPRKGAGDMTGTPNYRPWIMHPWTLCVYAVVPLVMLGIIEYLLQTSQQHIHLFSNHGHRRVMFREIIAQFFGLFVLLLVGLFFYDLDLAVKKMEPFYQLSKKDGADGQDSLCVDYFRPLIYFTPILAFHHSHWAVLCSSVAAIISTNALSTLALSIFTTDNNDVTVMDITSTRIFEACLGILSLMAGILAVLILRRKSGLEQFPDGFDCLIGFTSCRHLKTSLYSLFKERTRDDMTEEELNTVIRPLRFRLQRRVPGASSFDIVVVDYTKPASQEWYRTAWNAYKQMWNVNWKSQPTDKDQLNSRGWVWRAWNVCKAKLAIAWKWFKLPFRWCLRLGSAVSKVLCDISRRLTKRVQKFRSRWLWKGSHPTLLQAVPISGIAILLLALFVIANGPFWAASSGFFRFVMEKRLARSSVSNIVNLFIWAQIDKHTKLMEPMYLLLRPQGESYGVVARDYLGMWPFQDMYHSIVSFKNTRDRKTSDCVMVMVIMGTYASNLFGLFWNMLNLNDGSFSNGFYTIFFLMVACECIMFIALGVIIAYRRRPVIPRQPVTLASIISFIYRTDIIPPKGPVDTPTTLPPLVSRKESEKFAILVGEETPTPPSGDDAEVEDSRRDSDTSTLYSPGLDDNAGTQSRLPALPKIIESTVISDKPQSLESISGSCKDSTSDICTPDSPRVDDIAASENLECSEGISSSRPSGIITLSPPGVDGTAGTQHLIPPQCLGVGKSTTAPGTPRTSGSISGSFQHLVALRGLGNRQAPSSCSTSQTVLDAAPNDEASLVATAPSSACAKIEESRNSDETPDQPQTQCVCLEISDEDLKNRQDIVCAFGWLECEDGETQLGIWRWDSGIRPYIFGVEYSSMV